MKNEMDTKETRPHRITSVKKRTVIFLILLGLAIVFMRGRGSKSEKEGEIALQDSRDKLAEVNLVEKVDEEETTESSVPEEETEEKVWIVRQREDDFGDPVDGKYMMHGIFTDEDGRSVVVMLTSTDENDPIMSFTIDGIEDSLDLSQPIEMQVKVGEDAPLKYTPIKRTDDVDTFYMYDFYRHAILLYESAEDKSAVVDNLNNISEEAIKEATALCSARGIISLLHDREEDVKCIISNGENKYKFTLQYANFKSSFDEIWDYEEVCIKNDKLKKKYSEILNGVKSSDLSFSQNGASDNGENGTAATSFGIEIPQCPVVLEDYRYPYSIQIDSFEVLSAKYSGSGKMRIDYQIEGIATKDDRYVKAICYDNEGYSVDSAYIDLDSVSNERFRKKDYIYADESTVRIEFAIP